MNKIYLAILTIAVAFMSACDGSSSNIKVSNGNNQAAPTPAPSATIDELASGKKTYETNCMICHKADGTGGKISIEGKSIEADDLTSEKIKGFSDEKIIGYMMNGIPSEGMPAFKGKISEGAMRDVVKYIRTEIQKQ